MEFSYSFSTKESLLVAAMSNDQFSDAPAAQQLSRNQKRFLVYARDLINKRGNPQYLEAIKIALRGTFPGMENLSQEEKVSLRQILSEDED